jgi:hypothetical protein
MRCFKTQEAKELMIEIAIYRECDLGFIFFICK